MNVPTGNYVFTRIEQSGPSVITHIHIHIYPSPFACVPSTTAICLICGVIWYVVYDMNSNIIKLVDVMRADNDKDIYLAFQYMEINLHAVIRANILEEVIVYHPFRLFIYLSIPDINRRSVDRFTSDTFYINH
jgi:hypothetical protein